MDHDAQDPYRIRNGELSIAVQVSCLKLLRRGRLEPDDDAKKDGRILNGDRSIAVHVAQADAGSRPSLHGEDVGTEIDQILIRH